jgi:sporulation protein YlmC with PRC-barrel domain
MDNNLFQDNFSGKFEGDPDVNVNLKFLTASTIIGDKVLNMEDEDMGSIHDIMLDIRSGKIEYYVIEFGGFLGIGEKFFAIPFHLLKVDPEHKVFRFNEKRETLKKAPGFDKNHWPETNEHKQDYVNISWGFWDNPDEEEF